MSTYYPPKYHENQFNCPHCGVYARQTWRVLQAYQLGNTEAWGSHCSHCTKFSYWIQEELIYPKINITPPAHPDMPEDVKSLYEEASNVLSASPKTSAALLRLAVERLVRQLDESEKSINDAISSLVSKGLPVQIQQALDYCRVIGNNAVHPLEIDLDEEPSHAEMMFTMLNLIVQREITTRKAIEESFGALPQGALNAIGKRNQKSLQQTTE